MLKQGVTAEELKIYELYLQRIMKEYDLMWSRFKVYFGFNSGVLVVISFFLRPYLTATPLDIPNHISSICVFLSIIGIMFSVAWYLANKDGRRWMLLMNEIIEKAEDSIFEEKNCALYKEINETYSKSKKSDLNIDIVDINLYIPKVFSFIWLFLGVLSMIAL